MKFDNIFKISMYALRMNVSHPDIPRNMKWYLKFSLMHGIFTAVFCILIYNIVCHNIKENNFTKACTNGTFIIVYLVVTFIYSILIYYKNEIKDMIEKMKHDFESTQNLPSEERMLVLEYANKGKWVTKVWLITVCGAGITFPLKACLLMVYYAYMGEFRYIPIYDLAYPTVVDEMKDDFAVYIILTLIHLFYDMYAIITYIGFVPLGPIFMLHACGQLEIVKRRALNLFSRQETDIDSIEKIKVVVKHLQDIYSFVDHIRDTFKVFYEMTMKTTAVVIPITLYEVTEDLRQGILSLEFMVFIIAGFMLCFMPCYYGDKLVEKGEDVRLAVYMSGWELHWERRTRSSLLLMLVRTVRPVAIRTVFRTVCLDAFSELCNQSYAIFNVLNAAWN